MSPVRAQWARLFVAAFVLVCTNVLTVSPAHAASCSGQNACAENASFSATVTDFRTSVSGRFRVVAATMRIQNKLPRPLILGYLSASGVVTDDQGNRYVPYGNNIVRGMGLISGNKVDTNFVLQPGEASDARFEFLWAPGREVIGTQFTMDMTLQEITPVSANQFKLGQQRVLHFDNPAETATAVASSKASTKANSAASTVGSSAAAASTGALASAAPAGDPCAGLANCASGGPFVAEITSVTPGYYGSNNRHHLLKLNVRFRNLSQQPITLGYKSGSSTGTDNLGNTYYYGRAGTHDTSASGIGLITNNAADPSFTLAPGESRNATFQLTRFEVIKKQIGTAFAYDVVIPQLEILPSQQIRTTREYSLHFQNVSASGMGAASADLNQAVQGLKDLFKKKN